MLLSGDCSDELLWSSYFGPSRHAAAGNMNGYICTLSNFTAAGCLPMALACRQPFLVLDFGVSTCTQSVFEIQKAPAGSRLLLLLLHVH